MIGDFHYDKNTYDYYIVKIKITKVNKSQQNPFIGIKNKDGILEYKNDFGEDKIVYVDKLTLEDYITFHNIEYEFLDGVYWNSGFNKKMGDLIFDLFQSRLKYKKIMKSGETESIRNGANALQNIIKLMMNSTYGKNLIKKSNSKMSYKTNKERKGYIYSNFNTIKKIVEINDKQVQINEVCIDVSFNRNHLGGVILSMSKRIMNEVMDVCNENKINVYYQDTDSIHIQKKNTLRLGELFKVKYEKDLIGKNLGQFHSDFKMEGACSDIVSVKSIFLAKKCYIDKMKSTDEKGNVIYAYHIRMKGINKDALMFEASKQKYNDIFDVYEALLTEKIEFCLNPYESSVSFEYIPGGIKSRTMGKFTREVGFE